MTKRSGGFSGSRPTWTTTSTSGVFGLSDVAVLKADSKWPRGPISPTSLAGTPGDQQVPLTWVAPATAHGTITDYVVEYTPASGSPTVVSTGSTAAAYTLTGLTNDTEYTFRVAAVNHTRGDWSDGAAVTPAVQSTPSVTAPLNNYVTTSGQTASYSVSASGVTGESYQWQALITDTSTYTEQWQNIPGKTTASITLQQSDLDAISYDGASYIYVAIRCVVTHSGGSVNSSVAHHGQWQISGTIYIEMAGATTYSFPDGGETIGGIYYQTIALSGEGLSLSAMDMMNMGMGDFSWFTGNDWQFAVQQWTGGGTPTEAGVDWTDIHTAGSRQYGSMSHTIPASSGVGYYRTKVTRPWPLTASDGSSSAARDPYVYNTGHVKVTWS